MSYKERKEVTVFRCSRCGHEWIPKDLNKEPKVCPNPKCHSPYWKEPRIRETRKKYDLS